MNNAIQGPYKFQRQYKNDPNGDWHDIDYSRVHWGLREYHDDPIGLMAQAIAEGTIIETPLSRYRAIRKED